MKPLQLGLWGQPAGGIRSDISRSYCPTEVNQIYIGQRCYFPLLGSLAKLICVNMRFSFAPCFIGPPRGVCKVGRANMVPKHENYKS